MNLALLALVLTIPMDDIYLQPDFGYIRVEGLASDVPSEQEFNKGTQQTILLGQNYSNPFSPSTQIAFSLARESRATLKVFNILGQPVATLVVGTLSAGEHRVTFDAADLPSGEHLYEFRADGKRIVDKMLLMR